MTHHVGQKLPPDVKFGAPWSSPAERQQWEDRLNAHIDSLPPPQAPKPRRALPARRSLPAPRPSRLYARVSDALGRDPRLSASAIKLGLELVKTARGRPSVDGFLPYWADRIGRKVRMTQYAQRELEAAGYIRIEEIRDGSLNEANIYHLLAPLLAPPTLPRRRPSRRGPVGVQHFAPHEGVSEKPLPSELVAAREGDEKGGAGRAELGSPGEPGRPAARVVEGQRPTASPSRAPLVAPPALAIDTRAMRAARQGASAISPRAPP